MPEYPDVGCVAKLDIFTAGADNDKNVENETSLRVEAQRVSGCGYGEPRSAMAVSACEGLAGLEVVEPASCVQWLFITKRGHYKDVARKSKDTNNKNG